MFVLIDSNPLGFKLPLITLWASIAILFWFNPVVLSRLTKHSCFFLLDQEMAFDTGGVVFFLKGKKTK